MTQVDERIGLLLDQRYRLVAVIGVGGSARVYLADDLRLKRQVAVKILHSAQAGDERLRRRFEAEARSVAAFTHPHLVTVHDWGESPTGRRSRRAPVGSRLRSTRGCGPESRCGAIRPVPGPVQHLSQS